MPPNLVKPEHEQYWRRAKAQAEKQGQGGNYAYIVAIFKQMTLNKGELPMGMDFGEAPMKKSETLPPFYLPADKLKKSYPGNVQRGPLRIPGQVPTPAVMAAMRDFQAVQRMPQAPAELITSTPRLTAASVTHDLPLQKRTEWTTLVKQAGNAINEVTARAQVYAKAREDRLEPHLRRELAARTTDYYRAVQKSRVQVVTPDELRKAEARGGSYHRRVMGKSGRYRYYYDPEKYDSRDDAHLSGADAAKSYIRKCVTAQLTKAGKKGCDVGELQPLAKKYGAKTVANVLRQSRDDGFLTYSGRRLRLSKQPTGGNDAKG